MSDPFDSLWQLADIDSPSGDEAPMCDFLESLLPRMAPDVRLSRIGDSLIAWRGQPRFALFAHLDTTGYTLGYDDELIPIGSPKAKQGDPLRQAGQAGSGESLTRLGSRASKICGAGTATPGSRWVFDRPVTLVDGIISGPYLDNRAGLWAAIRSLVSCPDIAVAFTAGEETSGHGAIVCARYLVDVHKIAESFICDITWHTKHIRGGSGPAISLRDRYAPRQRFLDKVLQSTSESGIAFQREVESEGGSDGSYLLTAGVPMDWVFVGAPEEDPHTSLEKIHTSDLLGMADLLCYLVDNT